MDPLSLWTGITYLDHAATTLYPESLIRGYMQDISRNVYGEKALNNVFISYLLFSFVHKALKCCYMSPQETLTAVTPAAD